jgi:hypothetical protein
MSFSHQIFKKIGLGGQDPSELRILELIPSGAVRTGVTVISSGINSSRTMNLPE